MGQVETIGDGGETLVTPILTPPDVEVGRRRQDYLHRLGIPKQGKACTGAWNPSARAAEPPERLQQTLEPAGPAANRDFALKSLDLRGQEDFRVNFLCKLSYEKVWVPLAQRPPKHQTVILFDWDDTLLCTSFLNLRQDRSCPTSVVRHLVDIERVVIRLLEMAMRLGHTFIITNAMHGWVEYSAAQWVPQLLHVLQKLHVISARTRYEPHYPGEVAQWKIQAFLEVQQQLDSQLITNLISVGDSNFEMDAVHVMGQEFAHVLVKTIKFRENPTPEELLKQLELVSKKFECIVENARNLKIGLEKKRVGSPR